MAKTTKHARPAKALPEASAPLTASDVWRFSNSEVAQACNTLVGDTISDTLENCGFVLALRQTGSELSGAAEAGLCSVVDWVGDAIEKQAKELEVHHG